MLKNNIKYSFQVLKKDKVFSLINMFCFSIGIAVFAIITFYLIHEFSFDKHNKNYNRIFSVYWNSPKKQNYCANTSFVFASTVKNRVAEIEKLAQVSGIAWMYTGITKGNNSIKVENCFYSDPEIFDIFDFHFLSGGPGIFASKLNSILISKSGAGKVFGVMSIPVGSVIEMQMGSKKVILEVAGIFDDIPPNAHFRPDFILPMQMFREGSESLTDWGFHNPITYLLLNNPNAQNIADQNINKLLLEHSKDDYHLLPLSNMHINNIDIAGFGAKGDINKIYIYFAISLLMLLIASVNYINFSIARAFGRTKEIAIRKILGAGRFTLFKQLLLEPLVLVVVSLPLIIIFIILIIPYSEELINRNLHAVLFSTPLYIVALFGVILFTGMFSGVFSALFISSADPLNLINKKTKWSVKRGYLRRGLVFFQVAVFSGLIMCCYVIYGQMHYVKNCDIGYNKDCVVTCDLPGESYKDKWQTFLSELKKNPAFINGTVTSSLPSSIGNQMFTGGMVKSVKGEELSLQVIECDENYADVLGLKMAEGVFYNKGYNDPENSIIINEKLRNEMGLHRAAGGNLKIGQDFYCIGVVKNFIISSVYSDVPPIMFFKAGKLPIPDFHLLSRFAVKINPQQLNIAIPLLKVKWAEFFPDEICDYKFLDEEFDKKYKDDQRFGDLIFFFTFIAVVIAVAGLAGLTTYAISKKKKEIAVRKVLGASVSSIIIMLIKEVAIITLSGCIVITPVVYYYMEIWLRKFTLRIEMTSWLFIIAVVTTIIITLSSVILQAMQTAHGNQVDSLRSE